MSEPVEILGRNLLLSYIIHGERRKDINWI